MGGAIKAVGNVGKGLVKTAKAVVTAPGKIVSGQNVGQTLGDIGKGAAQTVGAANPLEIADRATNGITTKIISAVPVAGSIGNRYIGANKELASGNVTGKTLKNYGLQSLKVGAGFLAAPVAVEALGVTGTIAGAGIADQALKGNFKGAVSDLANQAIGSDLIPGDLRDAAGTARDAYKSAKPYLNLDRSVASPPAAPVYNTPAEAENKQGAVTGMLILAAMGIGGYFYFRRKK